MCIAYLSVGAHPDWPLFIAANRDEFHHRPARWAAPWTDYPDIIAGIDVQAGGTWLGVTRQGRFGLLTNYREPGVTLTGAPSRGALVGDYLMSSARPEEYALHVSAGAHAYNGFNLIIGDLNQAWYISNRSPEPRPQQLQAGRYVVSNHLLDTPWPKAERLRSVFEDLSTPSVGLSLSDIFASLKDTHPAPDNMLPQTGLSLERERLLSSPFIISPEYGTRCSTVIAIDKDGRGVLSETSYDAAGAATRRHDWPFRLTSSVPSDPRPVCSPA